MIPDNYNNYQLMCSFVIRYAIKWVTESTNMAGAQHNDSMDFLYSDRLDRFIAKWDLPLCADYIRRKTYEIRLQNTYQAGYQTQNQACLV